MSFRKFLIAGVMSLGMASTAYAQTAPTGAAASASPTGTVGTAATGTGGAVPEFDAQTGGGVATGANQTNGNQKTGLVGSIAQVGHTALPLGTAAVFSGAATITTAGTFQLLNTFTNGSNGCVVMDPASNPAGSTETIDWTGKTGTTGDAFTTVLTPGQTTQCLFVPAAGGTISITGSVAGLAVGGGAF